MTVHLFPLQFSRRILAGACSLGLGFATVASAQDISAAIQDTTAPPTAETPLRRGLGETIRSGVQGGNLGDSLRRGLGEAAQSAVESPAETARRDQRRGQPQLDARQRDQLGGTVYQDEQGQRYTLDAQGGRVYSQLQGTNALPGSQDPQAIVQGNAVRPWQANRQGPSLGIAIESAEQGVRVLDVRPRSAAEQAGIQRGDIITTVNGQNIDNPQALVQRIVAVTDGRVDLTILRDGQPTQLTAMLDAPQRPAADEGMQRVAKPAIEGTGLADQFSLLQSQLADLQKDVQTLRQEVMKLRSPDGAQPDNLQTETLNNTPPTSLNDEPADPFNSSSSATDGSIDDLFKNTPAPAENAAAAQAD